MLRQQHGFLPLCRPSHARGGLILSQTKGQRQTGKTCRAKDMSTTYNICLTCAASLLKCLAAGLVHLCYATAAQPAEQHDKPFKAHLPDISELSPQLQQEWHPDNNAQLGSIKVKPKSRKKVLWSCPNCPAGCHHIWTTPVQSRTNGTQCPYCRGRKLCEHNSLATKAPIVARYWDHNKNASTPEQTLAGSNKRADWKCPDCRYEWQATIAKRVTNNNRCPHCTCYNKKHTKQPTFEEGQHTLLHEWDHERNARDGIFPDNTTLQSHKLVHWVCQKCPKGQQHKYQMSPNHRLRRRPCGCPYCAGKQVCICNSLAACEPSIAAEWDFARNEGSPADVTSGSDQAVWWRNDRRGGWKQRIFQRTTSRKNAC